VASIPYDYECDKDSGFLPNPNQSQRAGYVTALNGLGSTMALNKDLTVFVPYNSTQQPAYRGVTLQAGSTVSQATVIGVIDKFSWAGGVGDPIMLDFWVSQQNATQIKAMQQTTLQSTKIQALGWWIIDYDQEAKMWFEQSFPKSAPTVSGTLSNGGSGLDVDLTATPAIPGADVYVYRISLSIVPAANQTYSLTFAASATRPVVKSWGLVLGTLSATIPPTL
jgi:hypothetical protein